MDSVSPPRVPGALPSLIIYLQDIHVRQVFETHKAEKDKTEFPCLSASTQPAFIVPQRYY